MIDRLFDKQKILPDLEHRKGEVIQQQPQLDRGGMAAATGRCDE